MRPKPGEDVPDSPAGILRVEDLPQPLLGKRQRLRQPVQAIQQRVAERFAHRHLFVRPPLDAAPRLVLGKRTRGQAHVSSGP